MSITLSDAGNQPSIIDRGSTTIFITSRGGKNHNGQLGYQLHQPLCGSLNDVSSRDQCVVLKNVILLTF